MKKTQAPVSRRGILAVTVTAAVLLTALLIVLSQLGGGGANQGLYAGIPQNGTTLGRGDAPVTILLYEDFQCPYCGQFSLDVLPQVLEDHVRSGDAAVRSRPMTFLGEDSLEAAHAALAAGEQDRYWQYHTLLFEEQGAENSGYVTDAFLGDLARRVPGLDTGRWSEARAGDAATAELQEVRAEAASSGVDSTPTLVVQGPEGERTLPGAASAEEVSAAVREVGGF